MDIYERIVEMVEKPTWRSLLIDTVKSEGLDPWDLDIEVLASKFAERIMKMKEMNLRIPANAVLASSILLRFKSDNWVFFPVEEDSGPVEVAVDGRVYEIPELPAVKRVTRRKVTLDDLIKAIEDVMQKELKKRRRSESRVVPWNPESILRTSFLESEEINEYSTRVMSELNEIKDENDLVLFSQLVSNQPREEVIKILLTLLHLANQDKVFLWQEDYFDEILIKVNGHGEEGNN